MFLSYVLRSEEKGEEKSNYTEPPNGSAVGELNLNVYTDTSP